MTEEVETTVIAKDEARSGSRYRGIMGIMGIGTLIAVVLIAVVIFFVAAESDDTQIDDDMAGRDVPQARVD